MVAAARTLSSSEQKGPDMSGFVSASSVFVDQPLSSREEVLAHLAHEAVEVGLAGDERATLDAFLAREREGETGMMGGFAIPHAKSEAIHEAGIIIEKLREPVEWPSFDDGPVDICIALLVPDGEAGTTHIRLLSQTAVMLMDEGFCAKMRELSDPEAIAELINARLETSE